MERSEYHKVCFLAQEGINYWEMQRIGVCDGCNIIVCPIDPNRSEVIATMSEAYQRQLLDGRSSEEHLLRNYLAI